MSQETRHKVKFILIIDNGYNLADMIVEQVL